MIIWPRTKENHLSRVQSKMSRSHDSTAYARIDKVFLRNGVVHATVTYSYNPLGPDPDIHQGIATLPVIDGKVTIHVAGHQFTVNVPHQPGYQRMAGGRKSLLQMYNEYKAMAGRRH